MLGENIRKYRKKKKMTQEDLAKAMGVSQGLVSSWEREAVQLTLPTIKEIAKVLGVTFNDLVGDDETLAPKEVPWGPIKENPRTLMLDGDPVIGWADDRPETQAIAAQVFAQALNSGVSKGETLAFFQSFSQLTPEERKTIMSNMMFLRSQHKGEEGT